MTDGPAEFIASFMDDYFAEAEEHLVAARRGLLVLEDAVGGADPPRGVVEELFRSFHSLKGISAMVELREAEQLAHEMETCLGAIRDRRFGLSAQGFDTLVEGISLLEQVIAARRTGGAIPNVDEHIGRLAARCGAGAPAGRRVGSPGRNAAPAPVDQARAWTVTFVPSPDLVARGIKVDTIRGRLAEAGRIERAVPRVTGEGGVAFEFQVSGVDESTLAS